MKSLLRSAATRAGAGLSRLSAATALKQSAAQLMSRRAFIPDTRLSAAVARVSDLVAATVSTREAGMRIAASFSDGTELALTLIPVAATFAPHGAKECSARVEPPEAALDPHSADIYAAICTEVARTLWGPLLKRNAARDKVAFAHREGDLLIVDLRSLPDVRSALTHPLSAAAIDMLGLRGITTTDGGLRLEPGLAGMPVP